MIKYITTYDCIKHIISLYRFRDVAEGYIWPNIQISVTCIIINKEFIKSARAISVLYSLIAMKI